MTSPFRRLHPSVKACRCGWLGHDVSAHVVKARCAYDRAAMTPQEFWHDHGEVPIYEDDERFDTETMLERSLSRQQLLDTL